MVWKASISVTDASATRAPKIVAERGAAVSGPAAWRIMGAGVRPRNQAERAAHFQFSSAAQDAATTTYATIWTREIGRTARSAAAVDCSSLAFTQRDLAS